MPQDTDINIFSYKPTLLTAKTLEKIRPVLDYRCMVSGSEQKFLLGLGVSQLLASHWRGVLCLEMWTASGHTCVFILLASQSSSVAFLEMQSQ